MTRLPDKRINVVRRGITFRATRYSCAGTSEARVASPAVPITSVAARGPQKEHLVKNRNLSALAVACLGLVVLLFASLPLARAEEHEQTAEQKAMMKEQMMKMQTMMKDEQQMKAMQTQMMQMMMADKMARKMLKDPEMQKMMDEHVKSTAGMMKKEMMDEKMMMQMEEKAMQDPEMMQMVHARMMMMRMMKMDPGMMKMMKGDEMMDEKETPTRK